MQFFRRLHFFNLFKLHEMLLCAYAAQLVSFAAREAVCVQGARSDGVFFIVEGECAVVKEMVVATAATSTAPDAQQQQQQSKSKQRTQAQAPRPASNLEMLSHPVAKPLEIASLGKYEMFGESCLFRYSPQHNSSALFSSHFV